MNIFWLEGEKDFDGVFLKITQPRLQISSSIPFFHYVVSVRWLAVYSV